MSNPFYQQPSTELNPLNITAMQEQDLTLIGAGFNGDRARQALSTEQLQFDASHIAPYFGSDSLDQHLPVQARRPQAVITQPMQTYTLGQQQTVQVIRPPQGPCYHPAVGWFYPACTSSASSQGARLPVVAAAPLHLADGYIGASPTATPVMDTPQPLSYTVVPSPNSISPRAVTPQQEAKAQPAQRRKPKHFDLEGYPEDHSDVPSKLVKTSINFRSDNKNGSEATMTGTEATQKHRGSIANTPAICDKAKRKTPSLDTYCICDLEASKPRVKRPRNAFILFRTTKMKEISRDLKKRGIHGKNGGIISQDISSIAAQLWAEAPEAEKAMYKRLADEEKRRHAAENPGYKYRPRGKGQKEGPRFGTPDCKCGAYAKNTAKVEAQKLDLRGLRIGVAEMAASPVDMAPPSLDQAMTHKGPVARAPVPPVQPSEGVPNFGCAVPAQEIGAAAASTVQQPLTQPMRQTPLDTTQNSISYAELEAFNTELSETLAPGSVDQEGQPGDQQSLHINAPASLPSAPPLGFENQAPSDLMPVTGDYQTVPDTSEDLKELFGGNYPDSMLPVEEFDWDAFDFGAFNSGPDDFEAELEAALVGRSCSRRPSTHSLKSNGWQKVNSSWSYEAQVFDPEVWEDAESAIQ